MSAALAILALGGAYCALLAFIYVTQDQRFFPADGEPFGDFPELGAASGKAVQSLRDGQALRYYLVPALGAPRAWVLIFHGNRHGARERFDYAKRLAPLGMNVVLAEYPGYAGDQGEPPTEALLLRNAMAMADEVEALRGSVPVVYLGESLGTGPATYAAMRRSPQGLILSTPYPTMADVAGSRYAWLPVGPFVRHRFPAWRWAPHVRVPVLVLHGSLDETIPLKLGRLQASRFARPELVVLAGRGHGDLRDADPPAFWEPVRRYLDDRLA